MLVSADPQTRGYRVLVITHALIHFLISGIVNSPASKNFSINSSLCSAAFSTNSALISSAFAFIFSGSGISTTISHILPSNL